MGENHSVRAGVTHGLSGARYAAVCSTHSGSVTSASQNRPCSAALAKSNIKRTPPNASSPWTVENNRNDPVGPPRRLKIELVDWIWAIASATRPGLIALVITIL